MQLHEQEIRYVVAMVWESMMQSTLEARESAMTDGERQYVSEVVIGGSWHGAIRLAVSAGVAARAAAMMFGLAEDQTTERHRSDAVNELANVVGGNLKPMLGEHCRLGIPQLVVMAGKAESGEGTVEYVVESRLSFEAEGQAVEVSVVKEVDVLPADWLEGLTAKAS
jgi:CheY-specific phosphatase CheX